MMSPRDNSEELRILLLRYLEGSVSQEEESKVSRLLQASPEASRELEELKRLTQTLKTDKTVFCPDLSEISEFCDTGDDPSGTIAAHLEECTSCREEANALKAFRPNANIPPEIWNRISDKLAQRSQRTPSSRRSESSGLTLWFYSLFRRPILAVGAAVVAAVLIVMLYPSKPTGPILALSSASWESDWTVKVPVVPGGRERTGLLMILKDLKPPINQQRIDSIYEGLKPDAEEQKRYDLVDPSRIKEALEGVASVGLPLEETVNMLQKKLGIRRVVVITLSSEDNQIRIRGELVDAASGKPLAKPVEEVASDQSLSSRLRNLVYGSLLLRVGTRGSQ